MDYLPTALIAVTGYGLYRYWTKKEDILQYIPGPPSPGFFFGHMRAISKADNSVLQEQWSQEYGNVITYNVFFGLKRMYTTDLKAMGHVMNNSFDYQKPEMMRWSLKRLLGPGLLVVEEDVHKNQRKLMNLAFGTAQLRALTEIFVEVSVQLKDVWAAQVEASDNQVAKIEVLSWLTKATLDIIGLAGFNYQFHSLKNDSNELGQAFNTVFNPDTSGIKLVFGILQATFPFLRVIPGMGGEREAAATMRRVGTQILKDTKAAANDPKARDLLSLLVKANTDKTIPENQKMSDEDVLAQVATFILAGHETTSNATTWALYALSLDPAIQTKLRNELLTIDTETPNMDELNSLPYLDAVVKEVCRFHAPVASTIRVATKNDILPLNQPFTDTLGRVHTGIPVTKGQTLFIPILALNRDKSIWGEDAFDFNPDRWTSVPDAAKSIPGVLPMMTFLGGPRSCIGYRFSLIEMKALLFVLVRAFEFQLAVPAEDITKKSSVVQRPLLRSAPEAGNQMPLLVKPHIR